MTRCGLIINLTKLFVYNYSNTQREQKKPTAAMKKLIVYLNLMVSPSFRKKVDVPLYKIG